MTLVALVEAGVDRDSSATALVTGAEVLDYAELDARANQLAHHLRRLGVGPDVIVGICVDRSPEMAVGLLGILKAGGACLPLDPSYPAERLAFMLHDSGAPVLLVKEHLADRLPPFAGALLRLDADWDSIGAGPGHRPEIEVTPDHIAYVIYTSGSTGKPKGVLLPHGSLAGHNAAATALYRLRPPDRVLQFCSIGFDVSIEELFVTWAGGATVVMRPDDLPILGASWLGWLRRQRVSVLNLPTAYWHEWVRDLESMGETVPEDLRLTIVGGEKALGAVYRRWLSVGGDRIRWINAYGPTETSVMATVYEVAAGSRDPTGDWPPDDWPSGDPPIGRALANTTLHVVDDHRRPVAPGLSGELCIGGAGLARGYLNRPELTDERFVPDPFSPRPGARLYRTGDLVRELPDANLEFLGRMDEQVKVRGFRIECGEIESALVAHPLVSEAAVVAPEGAPGERSLVAYVVGGGGERLDQRELRRFLAARLPAYMVPSAFVGLDALPLTPNGKVDRQALPAPARSRSVPDGTRVEPRTPTEQAIINIWSTVLGVEGLGVDDDFFELGGHSLQATQVIAKVRQVFGVETPVQTIFEVPTVAGLAAAVEAGSGGNLGASPLLPGDRQLHDRFPLSLSQEQMWQLEATADPAGLYNVTALQRFPGPIDKEALRGALGHLVERHETLRTSFSRDGGNPCQSVRSPFPVELEVCDLPATPGSDREAELQRRVREQDARAFDLDRAPLFRARVYELGDARSVLATTFDHLICDGTSAYVFASELAQAYDAFAQNATPRLRPLAVQYPDFALWQRRWLTEDRLEEQLEYWKEKLEGLPLGPALPFDRVPEHPSRRLASRPIAVAPLTYSAMERLARATQSTVFVVATAVVQSLFARRSGRTDVVLSTTLSGRQRAELEGLIGCFHGVGRIRTDLSGDPSFEEVVHRSRQSVLGLFEHQDVPFMRVRRAVLPALPAQGVDLLAAVPTELQYFHTTHDQWAPGAAVVERPGPDKGPVELFFRGQLHPLNVTFLDDGHQLWGHLTYKLDFYDDTTIERLALDLHRLLTAVTARPGLRLSELPLDTVGNRP